MAVFSAMNGIGLLRGARRHETRPMRNDSGCRRDTSIWCEMAKPNPHAAARLFCFPHAGGRASVFHTWHRELPADIEVCAIQPPGRATRMGEPAPADVPALVAQLGPAVAPMWDRPCVFFGHSLGALVSFELARWMRRHYGRVPEQLFVSGRRAPQFPDTRDPLHAAPEDVLLEAVRKMGGTPAEVLVEPELLRCVLPVLRADLRIAETYAYVDEPPLACPITALAGADDPTTSEDNIAAWHTQTSSLFSKHVLDGGHFFVETNRRRVLDVLVREMRRSIYDRTLMPRAASDTEGGGGNVR
jgi:medium-chain acyl-[acyl-carrier-protein] hydrolase